MRKSPAKKRKLLPDAKYNSKMVTQFVNNMMFDGKKSTAFRIFYDAMNVVEQKVEEESALDVWKKAVENITPSGKFAEYLSAGLIILYISTEFNKIKTPKI